MSRGLEGKVAVVTGATSGWGGGVARGLADEGVKVLVVARTPSNVEKAVEAIRSRGGTAAGHAQSVETLAGAREIVARAVEEFGQLDIYVGCAGGQLDGPLLEMTEEVWHACIATELYGAFSMTRAAAEQMVEQGTGGRILNVAGGAGMYGLPNMSAHAAAKGGVQSATWSWAEELKPHGITVNMFRGGVRSPSMSEFVTTLQNDMAKAGKEQSTTPRDLGFYEPEEAAPIVVWLASDEAADVTGCYFGLDGPLLSFWQPGPVVGSAWHFPHFTVDQVAVAVPRILARRPPKPWPEEVVVPSVDIVFRAQQRRETPPATTTV